MALRALIEEEEAFQRRIIAIQVSFRRRRACRTVKSRREELNWASTYEKRMTRIKYGEAKYRAFLPSVTVSITLNKAVDSIPEGSGERATFEANFKADVAAALRKFTKMPVTLQIIAITGISKGSLDGNQGAKSTLKHKATTKKLRRTKSTDMDPLRSSYDKNNPKTDASSKSAGNESTLVVDFRVLAPLLPTDPKL
jgi:hypothetical protein